MLALVAPLMVTRRAGGRAKCHVGGITINRRGGPGLGTPPPPPPPCRRMGAAAGWQPSRCPAVTSVPASEPTGASSVPTVQ